MHQRKNSLKLGANVYNLRGKEIGVQSFQKYSYVFQHNYKRATQTLSCTFCVFPQFNRAYYVLLFLFRDKNII